MSGASGDGVWMLGRDVVASWLNFLANNPEDTQDCIGTADDPTSAMSYLNDAIDWLQANGDKNQDNTFDFGNVVKGIAVKTSSSAWQQGGTGDGGTDPYASGAEIHSALDGYNNTGIINGVEYCCDADDQTALLVLAQIV